MIRYVEKNWHDNDGDVHMATSHKPIWAMIVLTDFDALGLPYSEGRQLSQCFVSKNIRKLSPQTCSDVEVLMATCDMCPSIFVWSQSYRISSEALVSCLICSKKCRVTTWPFLSWLQVGLSWWDFTFVCATNVKSSGQWWDSWISVIIPGPRPVNTWRVYDMNSPGAKAMWIWANDLQPYKAMKKSCLRHVKKTNGFKLRFSEVPNTFLVAKKSR